MSRDLSADLGPAFKGEYLEPLRPVRAKARMPVFHSVGASDPLEAADMQHAGSTTVCRTPSRSGFRMTV